VTVYILAVEARMNEINMDQSENCVQVWGRRRGGCRAHERSINHLKANTIIEKQNTITSFSLYWVRY
jgi:hypothetical protein